MPTQDNNKTNDLTLQDARSLAAGRGWFWINEGFRYFNQAKLLWMLTLFLLMFNLVILIYLFPIFQLIIVLIFPFITVGLAMACQAIESGEKMQVVYIFKGFSHVNKINILRYGLLFIFLMIIAQIVTSIILGLIGVPQETIAQEVQNLGNNKNASMQSIFDSPILIKYIVISIVVMLPVSAINLIAPYILTFSNLTAIQAIIYAFNGVLKNIKALIVYVLILIIFIITIVFFLKALNFVLMLFFASMPVLVFTLNLLVLLPLMLVFASITYCSAYVAFKDMFIGEEI